jgi:predicted ribosome quality control (RQC) complex YloA/Tae2 family protein
LLYDYEEDKEIEVSLDTKISPAKNAQNRYKKNTKLKHAEAVLKEQIQRRRTRFTTWRACWILS